MMQADEPTAVYLHVLPASMQLVVKFFFRNAGNLRTIPATEMSSSMVMPRFAPNGGTNAATMTLCSLAGFKMSDFCYELMGLDENDILLEDEGETLLVDEMLVLNEILTLNEKSAGGIDGWTFSLFKKVFEEPTPSSDTISSAAITLLCQFINKALAGKLHKTLWNVSRIVLIPKPGMS